MSENDFYIQEVEALIEKGYSRYDAERKIEKKYDIIFCSSDEKRMFDADFNNEFYD